MFRTKYLSIFRIFVINGSQNSSPRQLIRADCGNNFNAEYTLPDTTRSDYPVPIHTRWIKRILFHQTPCNVGRRASSQCIIGSITCVKATAIVTFGLFRFSFTSPVIPISYRFLDSDIFGLLNGVQYSLPVRLLEVDPTLPGCSLEGLGFFVSVFLICTVRWHFNTWSSTISKNGKVFITEVVGSQSGV